jgi:putative membrane protein
MIMAVVSLGMLGIEEAGVEVEDPFGQEPNHLPLEQICAMIGRDVADLTAGEPIDTGIISTRKPSHSP